MSGNTATFWKNSGHQPLLSLVIPHYNHNASLPRLLDSVMAQKMHNFEVIVVDDCSTQSCSDVIDAYASKSLPVRLIQNHTRRYTKNCRLAGVEASRGKIIAFADADDELLGTGNLAYHADMLQHENADIIQFAALETDIYRNKNVPLSCCWAPKKRLEGDTIFASYVADGLHPSYLWNKLYTRRLWDKIIPEASKGSGIRYFEDLLFLSLLYFHADRFINSDKTGYRHFFEDKKFIKAEGRIATLAHILREVVPYFVAQGKDEENVNNYARCIKAQLLKFMDRHVSRYDRPLREAVISWTVGERDDRSVCVMGTDRMRGLVGLACLSPEDAAGRFFLRNGRACSPVFQKRFPLRFMPGQTTFLNILWFAANERDTFTASIDGQPASFMRRPHANRDGATHGEGDAVLRMRQLLSPKGRLPGLRHRVISFLARLPFVRRHYEDAWLFVDRDFKADDNAEHLYRWVMRRHPEQKLYFALDKHSQDWQRLRQEGFRLLDFRSLRYYFTWLHCSWLISSNRTDYILQSKWRRWYADIIKHQCCFLQHGVTMSHQSSMNSPHLDMLITAAPAEYRAFAEDPQYQYVYSSRETQLTGLPRHDALLGKAAAQANPRRILIMPTWRGRLAADLVPGTGRRAYSPDFCRSDFFHQWQAVLSSPALHEIARRYGYHLVFYPHPYLRQQMRDFRFTGVELLPDVGGSIQDVISNAALLLTDYSSISLEFAQIRRPVLYFQFDRDSFYQGQPFSQGYFNYERDGFGPIAETVDELCALTEACLRGGCHMPEVYRRRAENFFAFADQNNCRRVYDAIIMASRAVDEKPEARP